MAFTDLSYGVYQGVLFAAKRLMNGAQIGGFMDLGDVEAFTIDPKQSFENIEESRSGYSFTAAHVPTKTDLNVKMTLIQGSMANWERAVWGTYGGTVAGGTVSGEAVTLYNGAMTPLAHPGVSAVSVSVGTVGVDFTVDAANGAILVMPTSTAVPVGAGTAATVSYTYDAFTGSVEAFTTSQPIFMLRLHAINTANNNQPTIVNVHQWAPDMTNMLELISKKHLKMDIGGMLLQDQTRPLPTAALPFSQFFSIQRA